MQAGPSHEFKVGDKAIYPSRGVTEVVSIEERKIGGNSLSFYVLRPLDEENDLTIRVAVSQAENVGLRPPISEEDIEEIFALLEEQPVAFDNQTWNRRYRGFMEKIKTGSVFDVAEVMRDLYRLQAEKSLSFGEKKMLERARNLVVKEIAVARARSEEKTQAEIEKIFEN
ncbi:MAG: CarD family transcriptional regulator [Polyangiales bacterium]